MSSPPPTPNALFSLVPLDCNAKGVIADVNNSHFVATLWNGQKVLSIGDNRPKKSTTLVSLGREDQDILIPHTSASKSQCIFEINPETNVVLIYDPTKKQRTHILAGNPNVFPFESGRARRVVVHDNINNVIGFSDKTGIFMKFRLEWHSTSLQASEEVKNRILHPEQRLGLRQARTSDDMDPVQDRDSRTGEYLPMRYICLSSPPFGQIQHGSVSKVLEIETGSFVALKILKSTDESPGNSTMIHEVLKGLEIISQQKRVSRIHSNQSSMHGLIRVNSRVLSNILRHKTGMDLGRKYSCTLEMGLLIP